MVKSCWAALFPPRGGFPLFKLIDAQDDLSVQVHPHDDYAQAQGEPWGKTELWYIVHSEPGAWIVWGLKPGVTKGQFAQAIEEGPGHLSLPKQGPCPAR